MTTIEIDDDFERFIRRAFDSRGIGGHEAVVNHLVKLLDGQHPSLEDSSVPIVTPRHNHSSMAYCDPMHCPGYKEDVL